MDSISSWSRLTQSEVIAEVAFGSGGWEVDSRRYTFSLLGYEAKKAGGGGEEHW